MPWVLIPKGWHSWWRSYACAGVKRVHKDARCYITGAVLFSVWIEEGSPVCLLQVDKPKVHVHASKGTSLKCDAQQQPEPENHISLSPMDSNSVIQVSVKCQDVPTATKHHANYADHNNHTINRSQSQK
jgi:hypothetical protein